MLNRRDVFVIHQLKEEGLSERQIADKLAIDRGSVTRYLKNPTPAVTTRARTSKLEPFYDSIKKMVDECPDAAATVILQRISTAVC